MKWWWQKIKVLSPLDGYNRWAQSYHRENNPIKSLSDDFVRRSVPELNRARVLDAGCGTGKFCVFAQENQASEISGIDLSPMMIREARKNCTMGHFECNDLTKVFVPFSHFDVIVCGLVLGHIDHLQTAINKLADGLKPGGVIVLTDFHPTQSANHAKRTFKDPATGKIFEVKHTGHATDTYFELLKAKGIEVSNFEEPAFEGRPVIFGIRGVKQR